MQRPIGTEPRQDEASLSPHASDQSRDAFISRKAAIQSQLEMLIQKCPPDSEFRHLREELRTNLQVLGHADDVGYLQAMMGQLVKNTGGDTAVSERDEWDRASKRPERIAPHDFRALARKTISELSEAVSE